MSVSVCMSCVVPCPIVQITTNWIDKIYLLEFTFQFLQLTHTLQRTTERQKTIISIRIECATATDTMITSSDSILSLKLYLLRVGLSWNRVVSFFINWMNPSDNWFAIRHRRNHKIKIRFRNVFSIQDSSHILVSSPNVVEHRWHESHSTQTPLLSLSRWWDPQITGVCHPALRRCEFRTNQEVKESRETNEWETRIKKMPQTKQFVVERSISGSTADDDIIAFCETRQITV